MSADSTRWLVSRVLVLKYSLLLLVLAATSGGIIYFSGERLSMVQFAEGTLYAVISALIISVFYDFFTRRELTILYETERNRQLELLGDRLLSSLDLKRLPAQDMAILAGQIVANEQATRAIAAALLGVHGEAFYETSLKPLVNQRVLYSVRVKNRLMGISDSSDTYAMEFRQLFKAPGVKTEFLVVFSCDNEFFNNLVTSNADIDGLVGTSRSEWDDIDEQLKTLFLKGFRYVDGHRETRALLGVPLTPDELRERIDQQAFDADCMRAVSFVLLDQGETWTYEFGYTVKNSLSYPYYYWFAENPMFVDEIEIDYQLLRSQIGGVSANCILGNKMIEPVHDQRVGTYTIEKPGLVWPGQGALIVWRPADSTATVADGTQ